MTILLRYAACSRFSVIITTSLQDRLSLLENGAANVSLFARIVYYTYMFYLFQEEEEDAGKFTSLPLASFNFINSIIGSGVIGKIQARIYLIAQKEKPSLFPLSRFLPSHEFINTIRLFVLFSTFYSCHPQLRPSFQRNEGIT